MVNMASVIKEIRNAQNSDCDIIPGAYVCRVAYIGERISRKGNALFCIDYDIAEGEHAGMRVYAHFHKNSPTNMAAFRRALLTISSGDKIKHSRQFIGALVNVSIKYSNTGQIVPVVFGRIRSEPTHERPVRYNDFWK